MTTTRQLLEIRRACTHIVTGPQLNHEEFGLSLRSLREDADISLEDMAGRLRVDADALNEFENGAGSLELGLQAEYVRQTARKEAIK